MSPVRTRRNRKSSLLSTAVAGPAVALTALATLATVPDLAHPAGQPALAHVADAAALPAGHSPGSRTGDSAQSASPTGMVRAGTTGAIAPAGSISGPHRYARHLAWRMLPHFHLSARRQYRYLSRLWERESGWNHLARNPYSGAWGIPQALPGRKMASAGPHWRRNCRTQIRWGLGYIRGRYRTPRRAWRHEVAYGWY